MILSLPRAAFGKPFIWYAEVVGLPAGIISDSLEAGSLLAKLSGMATSWWCAISTRAPPRQRRRGRPPPRILPAGERPPGTPDSAPFPDRPIDVALNMLQTSPAIAAFPIAAELPDGTVLIDVTAHSPTTSPASPPAISLRSPALFRPRGPGPVLHRWVRTTHAVTQHPFAPHLPRRQSAGPGGRPAARVDHHRTFLPVPARQADGMAGGRPAHRLLHGALHRLMSSNTGNLVATAT